MKTKDTETKRPIGRGGRGGNAGIIWPSHSTDVETEAQGEEGQSQFFLFSRSNSFFKGFLFLFLQRGEEKEKEGEKHQCVVASHTPPTGDLSRNSGMYLDQELNW